MNRVAIAIISLLTLLLVIQHCYYQKKINEKQVQVITQKKIEIKKDTIYITKEKHCSQIIKFDTIISQNFDTIIKQETLYLLDIKRYIYEDNLLYLTLRANYIDTSSIKYHIKLKQKDFENAIIFSYQFNDNYSLYYYKKIVKQFYLGNGLTYDKVNNQFKFNVSLMFLF
jgi:hypothetical protein